MATLRLDPNLQYFIELAARKQRRTVSSYLEWAAEQSLDRILLTDSTGSSHSLSDQRGELWDVDKIDRFVKLAFRYPDLLKHEEQILWRLIRENQYVWPHSDEEHSLAKLNLGKLHTLWDRFVAVAKGKASKSVLPD